MTYDPLHLSREALNSIAMARPPLPKKKNPLVQPGASPDYEELLSLRRLGQTKLTVKPTQVGISNATKPENLGVFEYAHLRAPLPKDLKGSQIFASHPNQPHPETYFLMRRSKDGFVSATGMFKIAFPWAKHAEEKLERSYLKIKETASQDEVAGNVWISPDLALELGEEYGMYNWVRALLDPSAIVQSPATTKKHISPPPRYEHFPGKPLLPTPSASKAPKSRSTRSASPSKTTSPAKKSAPVASPKKRQTKASKEANLADANAANAALQSALDDAASTVEQESVNGDTVKVEVESSIDVNGNTETTHTNVSVEMPSTMPELQPPEDPEDMVETAKKMVKEANALERESSLKTSKKRKADQVEPEELDADLPPQPAKKAKVLEEKLKREKVRTRALVGVSATLAIAAAIPYFF